MVDDPPFVQPPEEPTETQQQYRSHGADVEDVSSQGGSGNSLQRLDAACCSLSSVLGFDLHRRHNLLVLDSDTLAVAAGSVVLLLHLPSMTQKHLSTKDGGGVGAIALHPQRTHFAVAEKCRHRAPNM